MEIAIEISLYPLNANYIAPIRDFIERLNGDGRLKVITNSLSTQIFGEYDEVFALLLRELRTTFQREDKSVLVMKVLGPMAAA
ncbi:MAG TPA: YkoF family thiamine/hydroxymethylpyrimidine-binding protein [Steroidobacteraceae bacterium]